MTALSDIPCPICGAASRHSHSDREIFAWIKDAARWMKDAAARIATLEALIADAPHAISCREGMLKNYVTDEREACTCFKSRALDTKEKSND